MDAIGFFLFQFILWTEFLDQKYCLLLRGGAPSFLDNMVSSRGKLVFHVVLWCFFSIPDILFELLCPSHYMFIKNASTLFLFSFSFFLFFFFFFATLEGMWILVSWPGVEHILPAVEAWILNHWTTREVLPPFLFTFSWGSMAEKAMAPHSSTFA